MRSFQHIAPPFRLFSGPDCLGSLPRELQRLEAKRAVIVCGGTLSRSPLLDLLRTAMGERCAGVFGGVKAHSPLPAVLEAAAMLREAGADAIVAVGGGSAVVTARAASIFLAEKGSLAELATSQDSSGRMISPKLLAPKIPILIAPTTPTTAAVKAGTAVLDPEGQRRFALFDPKTRAQALFVHPDLLLSAPRDLAVSSSYDTMALALEGLTSRTTDPIADGLLMHALRLLALNLPSPDLATDADARMALMMAAVLAGQGTDFAGAGAATVLGHAIGALHGVENGVAKAIVLPHVLRYNGDAAPGGLANVAAAIGVAPGRGTIVDAVVDRLIELLASIGAPRRLAEIGVGEDSFAAIAERGMGDWFLRGNARPIRAAAELEEILRACG